MVMFWRILFIFIYIFSGAAWSAQYITTPDEKVEVKVSIYLADVFHIDDSQKSAFVKFFVSTKWKDRRLKGKYKKPTSIPINKIWHPRIEMMTRRNLVPDTNKFVTVDKDGLVSRLVRFTGTISFKAHYGDFPFDRQKLVFNFITPAGVTILKKADFKALRTRKFSIEGWVFGDGTFFEKDIDLGRHEAVIFKGLSMEIIGKRKSQFYLWKIFYPLTVILLIAGAVFGINPGQVPARISVTTVATLTLVAYDFVIASMVPTLSYLTQIDVFYFSSLGLVFFAFSGSVITTYLGSKNMTTAIKVSHILGVIYIMLLIILYFIILK